MTPGDAALAIAERVCEASCEALFVAPVVIQVSALASSSDTGSHPQGVGGWEGTAAHAAAGRGHAECLRVLLRHAGAGVITSLRDRRGSVALHAAARGGHADCAELLLAVGADPNDAGLGMRPLHNAVWGAHVACVRVLLAAGADPDAADLHGCTPLYRASAEGELPCMLALLDGGGAAVDKKSVHHQQVTPLVKACVSGHHRAASLLLLARAGANATAADVHGQTAVHYIVLQAPVHWGGQRVTVELKSRSLSNCLDELELRQRRPSTRRPTTATRHSPMRWSAGATLPAAAAAAAGLLAAGCTLPAGAQQLVGVIAAAVARCELLLAGAFLRVGPNAAAARLQQELAAAAANPFAALRLLQSPSFAPPGEAWWDEAEAERPPRYAAVLLDRAARAAAIRAYAELAEAEAAGRAVQVLERRRLTTELQKSFDGMRTRSTTLRETAEAGKAAYASAACAGKWGALIAVARAARRAEEGAIHEGD